MKKRVSSMWELYDALSSGLPRTGTVTRATPGERWTLVETDMGGAGYAMTTEGDSIAPRFPNGIEGMRIRVAAEAAKSWNFIEAGLGVAAINAYYNTPERMAELGCAEPYDNYCLRGIDVAGKKVGLIGHLRMPPGTLDAAESVRILEKHPKPGDYPDTACEFILPDCDIVLITGSSIVNKTLPRLLELCKNAYVVLTGPTVPLCPALLERGIDRLAGMVVTDRAGARRHAAECLEGPPYPYGRTFLLGRDI